MRLAVGLGNPGKDYENTRHNTGFLFVDRLKAKISNFQFPISNKFLAYKSTNFMNDSGSFVKNLVDQYKLDASDLYIIHDDLDIRLGEFKIQFGRGPKDHNGILDIEQKLGTKDFWRVRIGVDNRPLDNKTLGVEYVLEKFSDDELAILNRVIKEACKKLATL